MTMTMNRLLKTSNDMEQVMNMFQDAWFVQIEIYEEDEDNMGSKYCVGTAYLKEESGTYIYATKLWHDVLPDKMYEEIKARMEYLQEDKPDEFAVFNNVKDFINNYTDKSKYSTNIQL